MPADRPETCAACSHPPHVGACSRGMGGTAYGCGCLRATPTPPGAAPDAASGPKAPPRMPAPADARPMVVGGAFVKFDQPAPAPAPGAAERAGVEALRETLRYIDRTVLLTCGNVHHAKRDRGHPYSAECPVVERIKAKIAAALRGTNQGDQPKAGHDAPLGRGEGA